MTKTTKIFILITKTNIFNDTTGYNDMYFDKK